MSRYRVVFDQEGSGSYSVFAPEIPADADWGLIQDETRDDICEAIEQWIAAALAGGDPLNAQESTVEVVSLGPQELIRLLGSLEQ